MRRGSRAALVVNDHGEKVDAGAVYARNNLATISQIVNLLKRQTTPYEDAK